MVVAVAMIEAADENIKLFTFLEKVRYILCIGLFCFLNPMKKVFAFLPFYSDRSKMANFGGGQHGERREALHMNFQELFSRDRVSGNN